ncbi:P-type Cu2+ transporter [Geosmithia morbida]|uniref:P-type Cu2+ transporter n=1 Tax=Geosmithia morbida TaxID=1094350 RepID=A0A9P4Z434_9HYPO|nr:P-type Cu2+ transporter [Geosmithia morbida]KAF4126883.1 P-type Cu2+ transporter [Geosmithia morbida]
MPLFNPSGGMAKNGVAEVRDIEGGNGEAVGFVVSGMDCTSCADKLMCILGTMTGVSQAQVNFVRGNGKLSLDPATTNADEVLSFATMASGFSLAKVVGGDYFLDVITSLPGTATFINHPPHGVTDVQALGNDMARITYDPTLVGARTLYDSIRDRSRGLAPPLADPQLEDSRRRMWRQGFNTLLAGIFTIPVCIIAFHEDLASEKSGAVVSLVLATAVQGIAVVEFYRPALLTLRYSRIVEMDMLVVMSITAAYVYSAVAFGFTMVNRPLDQGQFFETSTLLITLILGGRLLAAFARVQAIKSVSLRSQQSTQAILVTETGEREIDARLLQYGDEFRVLPHSRIPTDGTVVAGRTDVDESMITGEGMPVTKHAGDMLIAGTLNGDGSVIASLMRLPGKNTVTDIAQLVEDAANSELKLQDLANKLASWFVPVIGSSAVIVFVVWTVIGLAVRHDGAGESVGNAVTYAVATLAVACPCAVGLAVPMVLVMVGGMAAKGGIIIKSGGTTERARKITDVVLDKTGTITEGGLRVVEQSRLQADGDEAAALAMALMAGGKHPVSAAVEKYLTSLMVGPAADVSDVRGIAGAGVEASYRGLRVRAGNARWTQTRHVGEVVRLREAGLTELVVVLGSRPLIVFGLRTELRPEAARVVAELQDRNMTQSAADVVLLNGLEGIPRLLDLSRAASHRMLFNFVWSGVYNVLAVSMASGVWVRFRIAPAYAGLGELVSVVPVILAAVSLWLVEF